MLKASGVPLAAALGLMLLTTAAAAHPSEGWKYLFNGNDLSGWRANREPDSFHVENGVITAHSTNNRSHLFYVGGGETLVKFKNFELVAVVKGEKDANSGIFIHTDEALRDEKSHLANGYEVQLNSSPKEKRPTGSLYDVVDLPEAPVDALHWFEVRIRVEDKRIRIWIDGTQTVDYTEPEHPERSPQRAGRLLRPEGGAIALQAHDEKSVFYFREIRILELDPNPSQ